MNPGGDQPAGGASKFRELLAALGRLFRDREREAQALAAEVAASRAEKAALREATERNKEQIARLEAEALRAANEASKAELRALAPADQRPRPPVGGARVREEKSAAAA